MPMPMPMLNSCSYLSSYYCTVHHLESGSRCSQAVYEQHLLANAVSATCAELMLREFATSSPRRERSMTAHPQSSSASRAKRTSLMLSDGAGDDQLDELSCTLRAYLSEPDLVDRPAGAPNDTLSSGLRAASVRTPSPLLLPTAESSSAASQAGDFCTPRGSTMTLTGDGDGVDENTDTVETTSFASPAASVLHLPSSPSAASTFSFHSAAATQSPSSFHSPSPSDRDPSDELYASVTSLNVASTSLNRFCAQRDPPDVEPQMLLYRQALERLRAGHVVHSRTMRQVSTCTRKSTVALFKRRQSITLLLWKLAPHLIYNTVL